MKDEHSIGKKLKFFRQLKGLSQKELSAGICSQAEISKIENGKTMPTVELLQQLVTVLRVPISELLKSNSEHQLEQVNILDQKLSTLLRENAFDECFHEMKKTQ
ncbi:helix-turn-helix domain-containing protein [Exiguobacterium indicum]|uniref:helix-turn-helix domain-containing protein n=1 Tax=Exiguobacterium indicum TaxID=296995 RepID=UPI002B25CD43|nr:helix-turn-helix transcriptional regulator [Exiguobacterium indicum]